MKKVNECEVTVKMVIFGKPKNLDESQRPLKLREAWNHGDGFGKSIIHREVVNLKTGRYGTYFFNVTWIQKKHRMDATL